MAQTPAERRREKLRNRSRQAVQTRDQKGLGRKSIVDWGMLLGKKPPSYSLKHGSKDNEVNSIDFLPWVVTQKWYKNLRTKSGLTTNLDIGDWDYKCELPVHKNVGEGNDTLICRRLAFGEKCYDCEKLFEEYEKEKQDDKKVSAYRPSWRCWYNIYDYSEESNPDGVYMVMEDVAYGNMEKAILAKADDGEETILYSDIEIGKTVKLKGREEIFMGIKFVKILNEDYIEFENRDPYTEEDIIGKTVSFDALVKLCTYEEFKAIREGIDKEDDDAKEPSKDETGKEEEQTGSTRGRRTPQTQSDGSDSKESSKAADWKQEDGCPKGLEFGKPDPEADECKACPDEIFKVCSAVADEEEKINNARRAANKSTDDNLPETAKTGRRRRSR